MTTGIWVALIGASLIVLGWISMYSDTIIGAAILGSGAASLILGILDAIFARQSTRSVRATLDDQ